MTEDQLVEIVRFAESFSRVFPGVLGLLAFLVGAFGYGDEDFVQPRPPSPRWAPAILVITGTVLVGCSVVTVYAHLEAQTPIEGRGGP